MQFIYSVETATQRPVKLLQKDTQAVLKLKIDNKCIDVILSSITAVARKLKQVLDRQHNYRNKYCQYVVITIMDHIISELR